MPDITGELNAALAGHYTLGRELGRGGMATVYLAEDLRHRRAVAIKVLSPEIARAIGPDRFLREIEVAARLRHPHILPLHDSGATDSLLFYVMPYVEGESLRARLTREKQLPLDDALRITREVADALSYAHSHGVVHRDIKPDNILLESGHAVVADFGIARAITAAGGDTLTATGMVLGTPAYMSPEQAGGSSAPDGRSDLYSLGCVLYEMLAGQPPFTGPTVESLVHQHLTAEAPSITLIRPAVPGSVTAAIRRALAKTPADRFSQVAQFADALTDGTSAAVAAATTIATAPATRRQRRLGWLGGAAAMIALGALLVPRPARRAPAPAGPAHAATTIAVLPLQNLSEAGPNAYFAGGLHEELLTQLAKVADLRVISRTSVMGYQGTSKPLKTIAEELGVGSVVEGTVQVVGGRLRVNVQLIDAATDKDLWAERYDRTLDDAFAIQSEVAQQIVRAVGVVLSSAERRRLAASPTANAEAYRLYLEGNEYYARPGYLRQDRETAQRLYDRALALDPKFALAHAALSLVHGQIYFLRYDPSKVRAARQREEAETALRLAPDLPQAHSAMGRVYYQGERDYRRALDEFAVALQGLPNDAELWSWIGAAHRRLGHWNEASDAFEKAVKLDPRDANLYFSGRAPTYELLRRYPDAVRMLDLALTLAPDLHEAALERGWVYLHWQGQLDTLRAALSRLPKDAQLGFSGPLVAPRARFLLWERNDEGLLQMLQSAGQDVFIGQRSFVPSALYAAWAYRLRGDRVAARRGFEAALARVDSAMVELPDDSRMHIARGLALAGLGRRAEALAEARWLQQTSAYREDFFDGPSLAEARAKILAQAGDADAALDEIERLLARPALFSAHALRLDPLWDPIREHPRFKALLVRYGGGAAAAR